MENIKNIIYPNVAAKNLILPTYSEEIAYPAKIGGEAQPVLSEGAYHFYFINPASEAFRAANVYLDGVEIEGASDVAAALTKITAAYAEDIPEFKPYVGQYYDVVTVDASSLEDGTYRLRYTANGSEMWRDFVVKVQEIYAPPTVGGDAQPEVSESTATAYFAVKYEPTTLTAEAGEVDMTTQSLGAITEETAESIPEFAAYIGWYAYTASATNLEDGSYDVVITADDAVDDSLSFVIEEEIEENA